MQPWSRPSASPLLSCWCERQEVVDEAEQDLSEGAVDDADMADINDDSGSDVEDEKAPVSSSVIVSAHSCIEVLALANSREAIFNAPPSFAIFPSWIVANTDVNPPQQSAKI